MITLGPTHRLEACAVRFAARCASWAAMRIQRGFTINDLLVASTQSTERNAAGNLQHHLAALVGAGVVRRLRRRVAGTHPTSNGFLKYQLLRDLGEIAPTLCPKTGVRHDHNFGQELVLRATCSFPVELYPAPGQQASPVHPIHSDLCLPHG